MVNSEEVVQPSKGNFCKGCQKEIEKDAKKCHHCGEYQNRLRNGLNILVSISSLGVLILLSWQLFILNKQTGITQDQVEVAKEQVKETKKKRIEAKVVLDEARNVKKNAESVLLSAKEALKKSDSVLKKSEAEVNQVSTKVNNIYQKVDDIDQKGQRAEKRLNTFTDRQNKLFKDVGEIKTELTAEVKRLKERNDIVALEDNAIANGDTASYVGLKRRLLSFKNIPYKSPNDLKYIKELFGATLSSILRVKSFYLTGTRVKMFEIYYIKAKDIKLINNKIPTEQLSKYLLKHSDWQWRTKAAELLRARKEKGVPDALIKGMADVRLDVRRACITSFEALTGYQNGDALDYDKLIEWWKENKEQWEKKLPKK